MVNCTNIIHLRTVTMHSSEDFCLKIVPQALFQSGQLIISQRSQPVWGRRNQTFLTSIRKLSPGLRIQVRTVFHDFNHSRIVPDHKTTSSKELEFQIKVFHLKFLDPKLEQKTASKYQLHRILHTWRWIMQFQMKDPVAYRRSESYTGHLLSNK